MKRWKTWLALAAVFICGVAVGSVATAGWIRGAVARFVRGGPPMAREVLVRRLVRDLKLDESQRAVADAVVSRAQQQLQDLRLRTLPEVESILEDGLTELKAVLGSEQQAKADELYVLARDRWQISLK